MQIQGLIRETLHTPPLNHKSVNFVLLSIIVKETNSSKTKQYWAEPTTYVNFNVDEMRIPSESLKHYQRNTILLKQNRLVGSFYVR